MTTDRNLRFAKQIGAEAIVVHMADWRPGLETSDKFDRDAKGWDVSPAKGKVWPVEELHALRVRVEAAGLRLAALENVSPALWHDILLDGPERDAQYELFRQTLRNMGAAGIPILGYNFTIAGVWGHVYGNFARGGARTVGYFGADGVPETPMPNGHVWNRVYDPSAPAGDMPTVTEKQFWDRHRRFLEAVLPAAEEAGVILAAHPDDPPVELLRGQPRLVRQPADFERLLDAVPHRNNQLLYCVGTAAEMQKTDIIGLSDHLLATGKVAYVHLRNVSGRVPHYTEDFIDVGDVPVSDLIALFTRHGYTGAIAPDHTPHPECDDSWHAGMAYALGWMRGAMAGARNRNLVTVDSL